MRKIIYFLILPLGFLLSCQSQSTRGTKVLIYTRNGEGYVHDNIAASVRAIEKICKAEGIGTEATDDPAVFTPGKLSEFDALIFSNANNGVFDTEDQRKAFQDFISSGKGFVAIHSSNAVERDWPWYREMLGGKFLRHPPHQEFDVIINDSKHPSTEMLPQPWKVSDECYYSNYLSPSIHVLMSADLRTVRDEEGEFPGDTSVFQMPLCWTHDFEGGKQWYTALGHDSATYENPLFVTHLRGGLLYVLGND